jgi:hypothetical protein
MKKEEINQRLDDTRIQLFDGHVYKDISKNNITIKSVTKLIEEYDHEFDQYQVSYNMAYHQSLTKNKDDIFSRQELILKEWEEKRLLAADRGTKIHKAIESYFKSLQANNLQWEKLAKKLFNDMSYGKLIRVEQMLYDDEYLIAGTVDRIVFVTVRSEVPIIDIYDTKTNLDTEKRDGIRFGSKNYMKNPISHLTSCEYTKDAMQLSIYAFILERKGFKIGELWIEWVKGPFDDPHYLPVPYMKYEAEVLLKAHQGKAIIMSNDDENW